VVNRPPNFSGAIGMYRITMRAEPTELQAEEPLVLTVRITGTGPVAKLQRPDLRQLPKFAKEFHVENLGERDLLAESAREFTYRLRPSSAEVRQIPSLPFVFFKPGIIPDYKGYQTTYAPAIALRVRPRTVVTPDVVKGVDARMDVPQSVYRLVEGPAVLRRDHPFSLPNPFAFASLLAIPPFLCGLWCVAWRRAHPDAGQRARQRRSRASQKALRALPSADRIKGREHAVRVGSILLDFLRERFDVAGAEPTPAEVAQHLQQAATAPALVQEVVAFLEACDAARFAPGFTTCENAWVDRGRQLVLALEANQ
jgi:hypothetical protein